jgi:hypothetical protein
VTGPCSQEGFLLRDLFSAFGRRRRASFLSRSFFDTVSTMLSALLIRSASVLPGTFGAGCGFIQVLAFRLCTVVSSSFPSFLLLRPPNIRGSGAQCHVPCPFCSPTFQTPSVSPRALEFRQQRRWRSSRTLAQAWHHPFRYTREARITSSILRVGCVATSVGPCGRCERIVKMATRPTIFKWRQTEPVCGPLVPSIFSVAAGCGGAAGRTRSGSRSYDGLAMGAALRPRIRATTAPAPEADEQVVAGR